jgi:AbrB family looped-hinge helix DNA binding protein
MAYGISIGMTLTIDKAGRVVLPKPLRDRMGLREGSDLEVEETLEGIVLKPVGMEASIVKKDGFWVYTGKVPRGFDVVRAVEEDREARIREIGGF